MAHRIPSKVAALVVHDRKLLLCFKEKIGWWITPGGKMEKGETPGECLDRELTEELGVTARSPRYFQTVLEELKEKPGHHIAILGFLCGLNGVPSASNEITKIQWFSLDDVQAGRDVAHGAKVFAEDLREHGLL